MAILSRSQYWCIESRTAHGKPYSWRLGCITILTWFLSMDVAIRNQNRTQLIALVSLDSFHKVGICVTLNQFDMCNNSSIGTSIFFRHSLDPYTHFSKRYSKSYNLILRLCDQYPLSKMARCFIRLWYGQCTLRNIHTHRSHFVEICHGLRSDDSVHILQA